MDAEKIGEGGERGGQSKADPSRHPQKQGTGYQINNNNGVRVRVRVRVRVSLMFTSKKH